MLTTPTWSEWLASFIWEQPTLPVTVADSIPCAPDEPMQKTGDEFLVELKAKIASRK